MVYRELYAICAFIACFSFCHDHYKPSDAFGKEGACVLFRFPPPENRFRPFNAVLTLNHNLNSLNFLPGLFQILDS